MYNCKDRTHGDKFELGLVWLVKQFQLIRFVLMKNKI